MQGKTGLFFAAAALLASLFSGSSQAGPSSRRTEEVGSDPDEEDPSKLLNLENVSFIIESSKVTKGGRHGTIITLSNGEMLENTGVTYDSFGADWPCFTMSFTSGPLRHVLVNPRKVNEVTKASFRRSNKDRPDTLIQSMGGSIVVREALREVRGALGRLS